VTRTSGPRAFPLRQPNAPAEHVEERRVYNVNVPTLSFFSAASRHPRTGTARIVCPGWWLCGGWRSTRKRSELQRWLNGLGVNVLHSPSTASPLPASGDRCSTWLRAVRIVRSRAADGASTRRPHRCVRLVRRAATWLPARRTLYHRRARRAHRHKRGRRRQGGAGAPYFIVLTYPVITMPPADSAPAASRTNLIGDAHPPVDLINRLSLELHVTAETPPAFIVHTQEDQVRPRRKLR